MWNGQQKIYQYVGVMPYETFGFQQHCVNTEMKVQARDYVLRNIVNRQWGTRTPCIEDDETRIMLLC
jgi:hypothetical protein